MRRNRASATSGKWRKSTYSADGSGSSAEIAVLTKAVHGRDSKDKAGPTLAFSPEAWTAFVNYARARNV
jgi:Domain of unknown function (DUF397)